MDMSITTKNQTRVSKSIYSSTHLRTYLKASYWVFQSFKVDNNFDQHKCLISKFHLHELTSKKKNQERDTQKKQSKR